MATPKSKLHEFYQKFGCTAAPKFEVTSISQSAQCPTFRCRVTLPPVTYAGYRFGQQVFVAESHSKKTSEHLAAVKALEFINSQGSLRKPTSQPALSSTATPSQSLQQGIGQQQSPLIHQQLLRATLLDSPVQASLPGQSQTLQAVGTPHQHAFPSNAVNQNGVMHDELPSISQQDTGERLPVVLDKMSRENLVEKLQKASARIAELERQLTGAREELKLERQQKKAAVMLLLRTPQQECHGPVPL